MTSPINAYTARMEKNTKLPSGQRTPLLLFGLNMRKQEKERNHLPRF
jgi:hypothetical protein